MGPWGHRENRHDTYDKVTDSDSRLTMVQRHRRDCRLGHSSRTMRGARVDPGDPLKFGRGLTRPS